MPNFDFYFHKTDEYLVKFLYLVDFFPVCIQTKLTETKLTELKNLKQI